MVTWHPPTAQHRNVVYRGTLYVRSLDLSGTIIADVPRTIPGLNSWTLTCQYVHNSQLNIHSHVQGLPAPDLFLPDKWLKQAFCFLPGKSDSDGMAQCYSKYILY